MLAEKLLKELEEKAAMKPTTLMHREVALGIITHAFKEVSEGFEPQFDHAGISVEHEHDALFSPIQVDSPSAADLDAVAKEQEISDATR